MISLLRPHQLDVDILSGELKYLPMANFSYKTIPENCYAVVPEYQEMILFNRITIDGNLILFGDIAFID